MENTSKFQLWKCMVLSFVRLRECNNFFSHEEEKNPLFWRVFSWSFQSSWAFLARKKPFGSSPLWAASWWGFSMHRLFPLPWPGLLPCLEKSSLILGKENQGLSFISCQGEMKDNNKAWGFLGNRKHYWCVAAIKNPGSGVEADWLVLFPFSLFRMA